VSAACRPGERAVNSSPTFHLRLFGAPSIEREGADASRLTGRVAQRHRVALLALVAMAPGRRLSRDKLITYLWPESDPERGRNLLKVSSYVVRTALGDGALVSEGDDLLLGADVVRVDAAEFEAALERANHAHAVALYRGPFLDGFFLSDAPEFEQWADGERACLAAGYAKALEALAEETEARRDFSTAAAHWRTRATLDPYDSRVALRLMRALEASGNRAGALQHASVHERVLQQEFGIAPAPAIAELAVRLRREPAAVSPALGGQDLAAAAPVGEPTPSVGTVRVPPFVAGAPQGGRFARDVKWSGTRWMVAIAIVVAVAVIGGALWRGRIGASRPDRSIAVLPFIDLSAAGDNDYFSDGLTEEIITGLSALPELRVISRTSAMHYKGTDRPLRQIAQELGVGHILEGSVRKSGARVRITAQLIDASADQHRWAQNYDTDLSDVLRVQEQIAREVVRAIERDSSYADAYAGMADAYSTANQLNLFGLPERELYSRTKWAAERALALDDRSADAHTSFATALQWQRNWPGAEREYRRAIELNPSHATARTWYSLLLAGFGERTAPNALTESRRAYELDPFAVVASSNYGWQCYLARDYDCAIEQYQRTIEISPTYGRGYARLGLAYAQKGALAEAIRALEKAIELDPERPDYIADLAYVQALRGDAAKALGTLQRAKGRPFEAFNIARAYVGLRQPDSAFAWLERSSWQWPHRAVRIDPALDPLRADPRFAQLAARVDRDMGMR
jgi:TolB-like protein/DNA-binding SARP family transcriptional activator